nr:hypothetical protein [Tanacetum cinerariifolium]
MKDVFEELESEVAQCAVDRKHDAIDRKNLLIANDNLIAECLPKEVFFVATKSELNVARFAKISDTKHTVKVQTKDSQLTKVTDPATNLQAQNDLFRAENDKVKQHYKELYDSIKITRAKHIKQVTKLTAKDVTLKTSVNKAKELLKYAIGTCPQGSQQRAKQLANTPLIRKKQVTIARPSDRQDSNKQAYVVAVKPYKTNVPPKSNPKTNRISPAKGANKLHVEDLPRTNNSHLRTTNRVDS